MVSYIAFVPCLLLLATVGIPAAASLPIVGPGFGIIRPIVPIVRPIVPIAPVVMPVVNVVGKGGRTPTKLGIKTEKPDSVLFDASGLPMAQGKIRKNLFEDKNYMVGGLGPSVLDANLDTSIALTHTHTNNLHHMLQVDGDINLPRGRRGRNNGFLVMANNRNQRFGSMRGGLRRVPMARDEWARNDMDDYGRPIGGGASGGAAPGDMGPIRDDMGPIRDDMGPIRDDRNGGYDPYDRYDFPVGRRSRGSYRRGSYRDELSLIHSGGAGGSTIIGGDMGLDGLVSIGGGAGSSTLIGGDMGMDGLVSIGGGAGGSTLIGGDMGMDGLVSIGGGAGGAGGSTIIGSDLGSDLTMINSGAGGAGGSTIIGGDMGGVVSIGGGAGGSTIVGGGLDDMTMINSNGKGGTTILRSDSPMPRSRGINGLNSGRRFY